MSLLLEGTNASEVNAAISAERHRLGATSTGMVLTFVIITDELHQSEATRAATFRQTNILAASSLSFHVPPAESRNSTPKCGLVIAKDRVRRSNCD